MMTMTIEMLSLFLLLLPYILAMKIIMQTHNEELRRERVIKSSNNDSNDNYFVIAIIVLLKRIKKLQRFLLSSQYELNEQRQ